MSGKGLPLPYSLTSMHTNGLGGIYAYGSLQQPALGLRTLGMQPAPSANYLRGLGMKPQESGIGSSRKQLQPDQRKLEIHRYQGKHEPDSGTFTIGNGETVGGAAPGNFPSLTSQDIQTRKLFDLEDYRRLFDLEDYRRLFDLEDYRHLFDLEDY